MFSVQFSFALIVFLSIKLLSRNTSSTVCLVPLIWQRLRGRGIQVGEWPEVRKRLFAHDHCGGIQKSCRDWLSPKSRVWRLCWNETSFRTVLEWTGVILAVHLWFFLPFYQHPTFSLGDQLFFSLVGFLIKISHSTPAKGWANDPRLLDEFNLWVEWHVSHWSDSCWPVKERLFVPEGRYPELLWSLILAFSFQFHELPYVL